MSTMALELLWILIILWCSFSALHGVRETIEIQEAVHRTPESDVFDYIIVGGGAAACPLAATLSKSFKVLLLERGGSPYGNPNLTYEDNVGANLLDLQPRDSPAQAFISTEGISNIRARVLGGGTSINIGFYNRASPKEISLMGLDPLLANSSFQWVERAIVSFPRLGPYQSVLRQSLLEAGVTPDNGASFDLQAGTQTGGSIFNERGVRMPASDLLLTYAHLNNILVLLHAEVQQVLFQGVRAHGVQYRDGSGKQHDVFLNKGSKSEVILCAGALGSPQILLLSGVGPADELQALGITPKVDVPGVGKGVRDNPAAFVLFNSTSKVESSRGKVVGIASSRFSFFIQGSSGVALSPGNPHAASIIQDVGGPASVGHLVLKSKDVSDTPLVTFNYLTQPRDLENCVAGMSTLEQVMLARSFRSYVNENQTLPSGGTVGAPGLQRCHERRRRLESYCKQQLRTIYHYHGGCRKGEVLDSTYSVAGTKNLRVVDASSFEFSPGSNPQATIMMLGRYMGVQILNERRPCN